MIMSKFNLDMSELYFGKEIFFRFCGILSEIENINGVYYLIL